MKNKRNVFPPSYCNNPPPLSHTHNLLFINLQLTVYLLLWNFCTCASIWIKSYTYFIVSLQLGQDYFAYTLTICIFFYYHEKKLGRSVVSKKILLIIKDLGILDSQNNVWTNSSIGRYNFKKGYHSLKTTYHLQKQLTKLWLKWNNATQFEIFEVSHISLQIGRIFVFYSSKVSNLKKPSKIRPKNDSFQTFEGLVS